MKKKSRTTEPPPQNGQQPKLPGAQNAPHRPQIPAPDPATAKTQETPSLHVGHPTNAMHHHGETL